MSILELILVFVNSVLSMLAGAAILACFPAFRKRIENAIYRFRTRNDPPGSRILVCASREDDGGWVTIGYGKMFRN